MKRLNISVLFLVCLLLLEFEDFAPEQNLRRGPGALFRATFCNQRESPDNFNFFELLIISPKIPFDELFLKTILKTSSDIYFFENFRKIDGYRKALLKQLHRTPARHHGCSLPRL